MIVHQRIRLLSAAGFRGGTYPRCNLKLSLSVLSPPQLTGVADEVTCEKCLQAMARQTDRALRGVRVCKSCIRYPSLSCIDCHGTGEVPIT